MQVSHMSGAGNSFAVVDARGYTGDLQKLAVQLCAQLHTDGFLALDHSQTADFKLHFYNPDGLRGEMCGNGARCICKFAYDLGLVGEKMTLETDAGLVFGRRIGAQEYAVQLNLPSVTELHRLGDCAYVELGDPGIPHAVLEMPDLTWEDKENLRSYGSRLRHDKAFPKGANVDFYRQLAPGQVRVLTYERGVEDFTLACGTGSASVAVVLWEKGLLPEGKLIAQNPGGTLTVTLETKENQLIAIQLQGPVETLN
ncbi:MAG: diaminopimelate epimerase [Oscillospiraceae bacterium]|nr:diaminopimelate epimerase [Oscillospiraceae bacterium]